LWSGSLYFFHKSLEGIPVCANAGGEKEKAEGTGKGGQDKEAKGFQVLGSILIVHLIQTLK
jgi:hypothetical protein